MKGYQKGQASIKGSIEVLGAVLLMAPASEGLLALTLKAGLKVFRQTLDTNDEGLAGGSKRTPYGTEATWVVMGGQKVSARRPRVRSKDGAELQLPMLGLFQKKDPLNKALLPRPLSGVSTRKYARTVDESTKDASCVSKSEVSRRFAKAMEMRMDEFFKRRIEGCYPAMMLDGLILGKMTIVAAMGIDSEGRKRSIRQARTRSGRRPSSSTVWLFSAI